MIEGILVIGGCIAYVWLMFFICEFCGFNKLDDEH
jgi:hypothetical protein